MRREILRAAQSLSQASRQTGIPDGSFPYQNAAEAAPGSKGDLFGCKYARFEYHVTWPVDLLPQFQGGEQIYPETSKVPGVYPHQGRTYSRCANPPELFFIMDLHQGGHAQVGGFSMQCSQFPGVRIAAINSTASAPAR
jgi:hypothetical protein